MREIKFRAWVKSENRMITDKQEFVPLIVTNKGVMKLQYQFEEDYYEILPNEWFEIMQYTGLKDRNDKEIYEGDILLRELYSSRDNSLFLKACFLVEFGEEGGFDMIKQYEQRNYKKWKKEYEKDKKYKQPLGSNFGVKLSEVEVIGNIYENPELLEVIE